MTIRQTTLRLFCVTAILIALSTLHPPCLHALTIEKVTFAESVQAGPVTLPLHNAALLHRYAR
jgi:hypothetical protein